MKRRHIRRHSILWVTPRRKIISLSISPILVWSVILGMICLFILPIVGMSRYFRVVRQQETINSKTHFKFKNQDKVLKEYNSAMKQLVRLTDAGSELWLKKGEGGFSPIYDQVLEEKLSSISFPEKNPKQLKGKLLRLLAHFEQIESVFRNTPRGWPLNSKDAYISSGYGPRPNPFGRRNVEFHEGLDISAPFRTPILATADGVVEKAGPYYGYGNAVIIRHDYNYETLYGHSSKVLVKKGQRVKRGDVIALVGKTGRSTGPHLHYEVRINTKAVNPYRYLFPRLAVKP